MYDDLDILQPSTFQFRITEEHFIQESGEDTIYEFMAKEDGTGWQHWRAHVPPWSYPKDQEQARFSRLIVPTLDSMRYQHLLSLAQATGKVTHSQSIKNDLMWCPHLMMSVGNVACIVRGRKSVTAYIS